MAGNLGKVPSIITTLFLLIYPLRAFLETLVQKLTKMIQISPYHERLEGRPKLDPILSNSSLWEAVFLQPGPGD